jgi:hypothetical protein
MYSIQEQFKTDALAQMTSRVGDAQRIAGNILDLSREIGVLNVRTTRASAEHLAGAVQKLFSAGNPGEFMQLAVSAMRPDMQLWNDYVAQLRSIAGKAGMPTAMPAAPLTTLLAPITALATAPVVIWPKPENIVPKTAAATAPVVETPATPEEVQPEAAITPVPATPSLAAVADVADVAAPKEDIAEEPKTAAVTPAATVEAIKEVVEAMSGASKAPPVVMAASTLPPEAPAKPRIKVAHKNAGARSGHKPAAPAAVKKAGAPARSASKGTRKG